MSLMLLAGEPRCKGFAGCGGQNLKLSAMVRVKPGNTAKPAQECPKRGSDQREAQMPFQPCQLNDPQRSMRDKPLDQNPIAWHRPNERHLHRWSWVKNWRQKAPLMLIRRCGKTGS